MSNFVHPALPSSTLSQRDLDDFSNRLIAAYCSVRCTFPNINRPIVKPQKRDKVDEASQSLAESHDSNRVQLHARILAQTEALQPVTGSVVPPIPQATVDKCFLHPKPKPSCKRCQAYLDLKRGTDSSPDPSHKKTRES